MQTNWYFKLFLSSLIGSSLSIPVHALNTSVGEAGIDAERLHNPPYTLTGRKIGIGQVEIGRPGKFGFDKVAAWHPVYNLKGIYFRNKDAKPNANVDHHAAMVATVLASQDKRLRGVAPAANLYTAAVGVLKYGGQIEECLAAQHIAQQNGEDVRAINFSFGESLERDSRQNATLDGNALLTQCIDWSARVHDVLYVVAGNQGKGGIPIPTDQYNGITTAYTAKRDGIYQKVDFANLSDFPLGVGRSLIKREINEGARRAINLTAPGHKLLLYDLSGKINEVSGTSFAAPHITGTVALLQEWGDRLLHTRQLHWGLAARRHEVMKAVLLNSADKIADQGNGLALGMTRTLFSKNSRTWLQSDAYRNPKIPLDIEMGTGHLNAYRAYQQFNGGQWSPRIKVPAIGWNYDSLPPQNHQEYSLKEPLVKDSFISITLAWDRQIELNDSNHNQQYDKGESFINRGLNNLDVYLLSESAAHTGYVCASLSDGDSLEHIFCRIPQTGYYKIRVQSRQSVTREAQPYAIAWWSAGKKATVKVPSR